MSNLRKDIEEICKDILYNTHVDSEKRRLVDSKENQLEMACPCCGDSKTNPSNGQNDARALVRSGAFLIIFR